MRVTFLATYNFGTLLSAVEPLRRTRTRETEEDVPVEMAETKETLGLGESINEAPHEEYHAQSEVLNGKFLDTFLYFLYYFNFF